MLLVAHVRFSSTPLQLGFLGLGFFGPLGPAVCPPGRQQKASDLMVFSSRSILFILSISKKCVRIAKKTIRNSKNDYAQNLILVNSMLVNFFVFCT